jgi:small subunit ribosomal protein S20
MPIKGSAKKYMRVTTRKTASNRTVKGVLKSTVKKVQKAASDGDVKAAREALRLAQKAIDKAARKNILKKNTAARKKSRLNALIKKASAK